MAGSAKSNGSTVPRVGGGELTISKLSDDSFEIKLVMDKDSFGTIQELASIRGVGLAEVVREALALERVFANSRMDDDRENKLYFYSKGELRELVAV